MLIFRHTPERLGLHMANSLPQQFICHILAGLFYKKPFLPDPNGPDGLVSAVCMVSVEQGRHRVVLVRYPIQGDVPALGAARFQPRHQWRVSHINFKIFLKSLKQNSGVFLIAVVD